MLKSILTVIVFILASNGHATTYYVDRLKPGSDTNDGKSESTPFLTIPKCVAVAAGPGNTCLVKNGTYSETNNALGLWINVGGTTTNPFTIKAYPGHFPKIDFGARLDVFIADYGWASEKHIGSVVIEGMEIANCSTGINFRSADHLVIRNNYIHHCTGQGVLGDGWGFLAEGNTIAHIGKLGSWLEHGFYMNGSDFILRNNVIYGASGTGIQVKCANRIDITNSNFEGCANWKILNNTIAYNGDSAIVVWGGNDNPSAPTIGNTSGIVVGNNIFYENEQSFNGTQGLNFLDVGAPNILDTNNISYNSRGKTNYYTPNNGLYTLVNENSNNPNFVNAPATRTPGYANSSAAPNFHLTSTNTNAIDKGVDYTDLGVTRDRDLVARPQGNGFDIGAYEFPSGTSTSTKPLAPKNLRVN
jgi:hypothetical protein